MLNYPNSWFIGQQKYTLGKNTDKIRKFNSYEEAKAYLASRRPAYTKDRSFEILYLTGRWWEDGARLNSFHPLENESPVEINKRLMDREIVSLVTKINTFEDLYDKDLQGMILALKEELELLQSKRRDLVRGQDAKALSE